MEAIKAKFDGRRIILPAQFSRTTPGDVVIVFEGRSAGTEKSAKEEDLNAMAESGSQDQPEPFIDRSRDPLFNFEVFKDDWPSDVSSNIDKYLHEDFVKRKLQ